MIVEPREERAYTIEAQSIDRRGFARATLAPREGMAGPLPVLRPPGVLGMADMGHGEWGPRRHGPSKMDHSKMDHAAMGHAAAAAPDTSGLVHVPPVDAPAGAKVLSYTDLKRLDRGYALNPPDRTIDIRLTGNMEKFIWSFDDRKYSEQPVIDFTQGETVRLVFKNETDDEPSDPSAWPLDGPRQRRGRGAAAQARGDRAALAAPSAVTVQMAEVGRWPFHCHFLFHMMTGMFREFVVHPRGGGAAGCVVAGTDDARTRPCASWLAAHERSRHWSGALPAMIAIAVCRRLAALAVAMDDQATYWRFDGRAEKRIFGIAPATEWAASAWIGDDLTKLRLYNSGIVGDPGHIDNEGGTQGHRQPLLLQPPDLRLLGRQGRRVVHRVRRGRNALGLRRRRRGPRALRHPCRCRAAASARPAW